MAPDINSSGENSIVEAGRRFLRSWVLAKSEPAPSPAAASPPNLDGHSDVDPFAQARDQFLQNLPDDARQVFAAGCSSASALRKEMQTLLANSSHFHQAHRASKLLQRIQGLSDRLEPYFAVVSIVVSSNPEYAAIVWGALRLLLVLGRNFGDFFEKLSLTIERIAAHFPQYAALLRHAEGLGSASDAFKSSLCAIYTDVLEFFASAAGIFVTDRGEKRRPLVVTGSLMWKPFDKRFQHILERMEMHREILTGEIILLGLANATLWQRMRAEERQRTALKEHESSCHQANTEQAMRELQNEAKRSAFVQLKEWLGPPNFVECLEEAQLACEDGTAFWLFERSEFLRWRSAEIEVQRHGEDTVKPPVLWIQGPMGSGKTILAGSAVKELCGLPLTADGAQPTVCYYFFNQRKFANKPLLAIQSILAQILQQRRWDNRILDTFSFASIEQTGGQLAASRLEMMDLLRVCFRHLDNAYIVLDGLDECEDSDEFLSFLLRTSCGSKARFLCFSRPTVKLLLSTVPELDSVKMEKEFVGPDIRRFLAVHLQRMAGEGLFAPHKDISAYVEQLFNGSDGMFLWAKLMINYLQSPALTPHERIRTIQRVVRPELLDDMYRRILSALQGSGHPVRALATKVFSWLLHCRTELTVDELHDAVTISNEAPVAGSTKYPNFDHTLFLTCNGLVTISPTRVCSFFHLSVHDFLRDRRQSLGAVGEFASGSGTLVPTEFDGHWEILKCCVDYLTAQEPALPQQGRPLSTLRLGTAADLVTERLSLNRYSSLHWFHHLSSIRGLLEGKSSDRAKQTRDVVALLGRLISNQLAMTLWLESIYLFELGGVSPARELLAWGAFIAGVSTSDKESDDLGLHSQLVLELAADLDNIHNVWGQNLLKKPCIVWGDLTAYTPSKFLARTNEVRMTTLRPEQLHHTSATLPLKTISKVSIDDSKIGVLSVWPSKQFQDWLNNEDFVPTNHITDLKPVCSGWLVRFEVWTVAEPVSRVRQFQCSLSETEVRLQICQSLCKNVITGYNKSSKNGWMIQFPMIISADLSTLVVLRTVFFLSEASGSATDPTYCTATIPISDPGHAAEYWTDRSCAHRECPTGVFYGSLKSPYHALYRYIFSISPDGRFLVFLGTDYGKSGTCNGHDVTGDPSYVTGSIYWLVPQDHTTKVRLLQTFRPSLFDVREGDVAFHPQLPLAAVLSYHSYLYLIALNAHEEATIVTRNTHGVGNSVDLHCSIHFSDCGTQIGIVGAHISVPTVIDVQGHAIFKTAVSNDLGFRQHSALNGRALVTTSKLLLPLLARTAETQIRFASRLHEMTEHAFNDYQVSTSGGHHAGSHASSVRSLSVGLDGHIASQVLTHLPRWGNLDARSVRILPPSGGDGTLTLVLNRVSERWTTMDNEAQLAMLPAVLTKDLRALEPVEITRPREMLAGNSGSGVVDEGEGSAGIGGSLMELAHRRSGK